MARLASLVEAEGACALPGCSLKFETFIPVMWRAVERGFVAQADAEHVFDGLRYGFNGGVIKELLMGKGEQIFKNYRTALEARSYVTKALNARITASKSIVLGTWTTALHGSLSSIYGDFSIFPLGAQKKALEDAYRPTSDHTRTGLNEATNLRYLRHSLDTYNEIAWNLLNGYFMRVSDVKDAFPTLPLAPWLWPFFMCRFFLNDDSDTSSLIMHLFADFGAAGVPGEFYVFFVKVVVNMARSELVLTLPMPIYVDDMGLIGRDASFIDAEMRAFQLWALAVIGLAFKWLKDKTAATRQLMIGFWWDSRARTRTLEENRLASYLKMLLEFSSRRVLSLVERQQIAGRMHRAVMTLPPGASCFLSNMFNLARGLRLPWHKRRTTAAEKGDYCTLHRLLSANLGRGYFSYDLFTWAYPCFSDACKSARFAGGGWISGCGRFNFFTYGASDRRKPIDFLEGDTFLAAVEQLCHTWHRKLVPFGIDNQAMQRSQVKGWSVADRLNVILRRLFELQLRHEFILVTFWLSSADNLVADDLSRNRITDAVSHAYLLGHWSEDTWMRQHYSAGSQRISASMERVPEPTLSAATRLAKVVKSHLSHKAWNKLVKIMTGNGKSYCGSLITDFLSVFSRNNRYFIIFLLCLTFSPPVAAGKEGSAINLRCISYSRVSIFDGLPGSCITRIDEMLDNRLAASSMRTVMAGVHLWYEVADTYGWDHIIFSMDPLRGGKLAAYITYLTDDTSLVWATIRGYIWGLRHWFKLQHQADPVYGVEEFDELMKACKVLTIVPGEPRRRFKLETLELILDDCDETSFQYVQFVFFCLICIMTYSRSECPCPKSFTGRESFDASEHWCVEDIVPMLVHGVWCMGVRFKVIKQDLRVERPEAHGNADWAYLGDLPGSKWSIFSWYRKLMKFYSRGRLDPKAPFFTSKDGVRPYTYAAATADLKFYLLKLNLDPAKEGTLHGLRVEGHDLTCRNHPLGESIAEAHGLWKSGARTRYNRFQIVGDVLPIANAIFGVATPSSAPRNVKTAGTHRRSAASSSSESSSDPEGDVLFLSEGAELPEGWTRTVRRDAKGINRTSFTGPEGQKCYSMPQVRKVLRAAAARVPAPSPSPRARSTTPSHSPRRQSKKKSREINGLRI